jgi:cytochrome P450
MDQGRDVPGLLRELSRWKSFAILFGGLQEFRPFVDKLIELFPQRRLGVQYIRHFIESQVDQRINHTCMASSTKVGKIPGRLFVDNCRKTLENLECSGLLLSCLTNLSASSDKTAVSISWAIYYLYMNTQTLQTLRQEIYMLLEAGQLSDPVTTVQVRRMPYLQAVLKEALRLQPPSEQPIMRIVPDGGIILDGQFFGKGVSAHGTVHLHWTNVSQELCRYSYSGGMSQ